MRRFSFLELLVAVALSAVLIGTVATLFGRFTELQAGLDERLEERWEVGALTQRLGEDGARAVGIAELARCFVHTPTQVDVAPGRQLRLDQLELVLRDPTRGTLERVRWSVVWDPARETGHLWRETWPVAARELPVGLTHLAGGASSRTLVASGVTRFEVGVPDRGEQPTQTADLVREGSARVLHDQVWELTPPLVGLRAGDWLWLEDDRVDRRGFRAGYYRVRTIEGDLLSAARRIGNSSQALYRAVVLPTQLSVDLVVGGARQQAQLGLGLPEARRDLLHATPPRPRRKRR